MVSTDLPKGKSLRYYPAYSMLHELTIDLEGLNPPVIEARKSRVEIRLWHGFH